MEKSPTGLYTAAATFVSFHLGSGKPVKVPARSIAREGHPIIEANPTMWVPLRVDFDAPTATAATASSSGDGEGEGGEQRKPRTRAQSKASG